MEISVKWIAIGILCSKISLSICEYPKYFVEDLCRLGNETILYDTSKLGIAGTINATSHPPIRPNKHCTLIIKPPLGKGIVISLNKVDFRENTFVCQDYLRIFHSDIFTSPTIVCRFIFDLDGKTTFYSDGTLKIIYHVDPEDYFSRLAYERGFSLTYTVVSEDLGECMKSNMFLCDNGRCISKTLTCDGQNNCGDRSDETHLLCDSKVLSYFHLTELMYVIVFCILILIIIVSSAVVVSRRRRRIDDTDSVSDQDEPTARLTPFQAVHPTGFFICQNPAGPEGLFPQHPKIVQVEGGFTNPCYPNGFPQAPPPYSQ